MYRVARSRLRDARLDPDGALDVVHQVFLNVLQKPPKSPPTSTAGWEPYLIRSVINKIIDQVRSAEHRHRTDAPDAIAELAAQPSCEVAVEDQAVREINRQRLATLVAAAVAGLPDDQRHAVHGRVWQHRTNEEIAMTLNCTPSWVSQLFNAAAATLRATLAADADHADRPRPVGGKP